MSAALVAVRFLKAYRVYNSGETAGFDEDTALELIDSGIAAPMDDAPTKAKASRKPKGSAHAEKETGEGAGADASGEGGQGRGAEG